MIPTVPKCSEDANCTPEVSVGSPAKVAANKASPPNSMLQRTLSRRPDGRMLFNETSEEDMTLYQRVVAVGDVFGYDPSQQERARLKYRHGCGCFATFALFFSMIVIIVLSLLEYNDNMTFVMESRIQDVSYVSVPDDYFLRLGMSCCQFDSTNINSDPCDSTGYLDITWSQRTILTQSIFLPANDISSETCTFTLSSGGAETLAVCPMAPQTFELQAYYEADVYKYIQATVSTCQNSTDPGVAPHCYSPDVIAAYQSGLVCSFLVEQEAPDIPLIENPGLGDVDFLEQRFTTSKRFPFVPNVVLKIDVFLSLLEVNVESFIVHVKSWIQSTQALIFSHFESVLEGTTASNPELMKLYFRMDHSRKSAMVTPFITLVKLMGSWGSYFTLFFSIFAGGVFVANLYIHHSSVEEALAAVGIGKKRNTGDAGASGKRRNTGGVAPDPFIVPGKSE